MLSPLPDILEDRGLAEGHRRTLRMFERNALRLLKQINNMLDLAKLEGSELPAEMTPLDVIARATARDPGERFSAAEELAAALKGYNRSPDELRLHGTESSEHDTHLTPTIG